MGQFNVFLDACACLRGFPELKSRRLIKPVPATPNQMAQRDTSARLQSFERVGFIYDYCDFVI